MSTTMSISLPGDLRAFGSTSEYVCDLIRRQRDVETLRGLLREGLESGPPEPVTAEWFDDLCGRARRHGAARKAG